ncbi:YigZ family protein [Microaerobacter geothermalis]|uniref:YigZ family protein n=1 Tax=Microaerobacter geothermalis TaxID=674972 RepID=UPI001F1EDA22|nr:YigZ family protein [Microaerobacter geothermalis]MCF6093173.1 YigZ family protein [Microaerobacter geothermalis]
MLERYVTVSGYGEAEITINRSRFISYVQRAETEEEALSFIQQIKKKHWDATHNCSAYIVGEMDQFQRADDDGEPSGTAGKPMLEVLKKTGVKDTVVVVTRYFGGIKLGAGGLVRAYGKGVTLGLRAAKLIERVLHEEVNIEFDYHFLGKLENELRNNGFLIINTQFTDKVTITLLALKNQWERLHELVNQITSGQASMSKGSKAYVDISLHETSSEWGE